MLSNMEKAYGESNDIAMIMQSNPKPFNSSDLGDGVKMCQMCVRNYPDIPDFLSRNSPPSCPHKKSCRSQATSPHRQLSAFHPRPSLAKCVLPCWGEAGLRA
jgi:hypothetical protein